MAFSLCLTGSAALTQDVIRTLSGEEIVGKVLHVGAEEVVYRHFSDTDGPVFKLARKEVANLRLMAVADPMASAEVVFEDEQTNINSEDELAAQGRYDAKEYYKARGVLWATLGSTVIYPAAGLVTGTVAAVMPSNLESDYNPNRHLLKEPAYQRAYQKQAGKIRVRKAATGFSVGLAALSAVYMVVANLGS